MLSLWLYERPRFCEDGVTVAAERLDYVEGRKILAQLGATVSKIIVSINYNLQVSNFRAIKNL